MILTADEIYGMYSEPSSDAEMVEFARAVEAAVIAKLGTVEMPEPDIRLSVDDHGKWVESTAASAEPVYTADQLRTVAAAARLKALEEAAVVCDEVAETISSLSVLGATRCGIAIRALKGTTP